jgi:hypothetical protein
MSEANRPAESKDPYPRDTSNLILRSHRVFK